jgi:hypothetical protein
VYSSYDLGNFKDVVAYCAEGRRRFPKDRDFTECRLWLMTMKSGEPNVPLAWALSDSLVAMDPEAKRPYTRLYNNSILAAVLARAGLKDSARRVLGRSKGNSEIDPNAELANIQAFVYTLLGDRDAAIAMLQTYFTANPGRRENMVDDSGWWFRDLDSDPRYLALIGRKP